MSERTSAKIGRTVERWAVKQRDPNRSDSAGVVGSKSAGEVVAPVGVEDVDKAAETARPTCAVPTDGANLRGCTPANPMVRDPGLVMRGTGWTISSLANRRIRSRSILLIGDGDYKGAKASAHKARVTDCVLVPRTADKRHMGHDLPSFRPPEGKPYMLLV